MSAPGRARSPSPSPRACPGPRWPRSTSRGKRSRWPRRTPRRQASTDRLELLEGDLLAPVAGRRFDLVASNPPYVAPGESVDPEVADFEPALAVYAEDAGRAIVGRLAVDSLAALHPGGHLVVEVADGQAPWLAERLAGLGYGAIAVTRDLRGIERVVEAQLPP